MRDFADFSLVVEVFFVLALHQDFGICCHNWTLKCHFGAWCSWVLVLMCYLVRQLLLRVLWNYSFSYATTVVVNIIFFGLCSISLWRWWMGSLQQHTRKATSSTSTQWNCCLSRASCRNQSMSRSRYLFFLLHCLLAVLWKMEPRCLIRLITFFIFVLDS